ncbi:alpha/beta hydrolase [Roseovarius spongiae]|uniref:Alpha/beta hydrolase n=1 Tax=Roseovarius spongiae TaxID=2320272 RepID=A0A3A8B9I5_9RHOB|nr:alpha/beta hydrolase [Roseovarius spongiae]RKF14843.1 alpha/beta hydrolase [Roseovarius spongiae]
MESAPFLADIDDGPPGGRAVWATGADGVRIRVGHWPREGAAGTVLLFPGRTEYIEKYGRTARDLGARGYATLAVDWRGQGLADRLGEDAMAGYVRDFADYQYDVAAMLGAAEALGAARPLHLLAHSMGGCIGLRALIDGLPAAACAFTGPMWGIRIEPPLRPLAWALSCGGSRLGFGHMYAPGGGPENYVLHEPFETNKLTSDSQMYQYMIDQARAHPELGLGGPTLRWLYEALTECRALARLPSPELPCVTAIGDEEDIVDVARIEDRMDRWPDGRLLRFPGARHEVLMEGPEVREDLFDAICARFDAAARQ